METPVGFGNPPVFPRKEFPKELRPALDPPSYSPIGVVLVQKQIGIYAGFFMSVRHPRISGRRTVSF